MLPWIAWLLLLILSAVPFGKGLAADRNHRWPVNEPNTTGTRILNKDDFENVPVHNASHLQDIAVHNSANYSVEGDGREKEDEYGLSELTVANRSRIHINGSVNSSVSNNSANKTASSVNVTSAERALNDSASSPVSDSSNALNHSQPENIVRATLCVNSSTEKETMRIEMEFASTLLENG